MSTDIEKVKKQDVERASQRRVMTPPVDILENKDELLVIADVPGASAEGLKIGFENDQLTIEAAPKPMELSGTALFQEFHDFDYRRVFQVAPGIDSENISAELTNGVLRIHLPKSPALKPRQIPVTSE